MFVHSIKSAVRLAAAVASIGLAGVSSAAVWINQGYSRPIDPATNLPVPLANLTDFRAWFKSRWFWVTECSRSPWRRETSQDKTGMCWARTSVL